MRSSPVRRRSPRLLVFTKGFILFDVAWTVLLLLERIIMIEYSLSAREVSIIVDKYEMEWYYLLYNLYEWSEVLYVYAYRSIYYNVYLFLFCLGFFTRALNALPLHG